MYLYIALTKCITYSFFSDILKIFLIIPPVTSCSSERSLSKLALVKSKLRNAIERNRHDSSLLLFVEQDLPTRMDYNDVVEEFKVLVHGERRLALTVIDLSPMTTRPIVSFNRYIYYIFISTI